MWTGEIGPNPERFKTRKNHYYKRNFGISVSDFERMVREQDSRCAICDKQEKDGRNLAVDHCHKTNKVRALLCGQCNMLLGRIENNPKLIKKMMIYLKLYN
jgi:hypothetical protein